MDGLTDRRTFTILESLLRLKNLLFTVVDIGGTDGVEMKIYKFIVDVEAVNTSNEGGG